MNKISRITRRILQSFAEFRSNWMSITDGIIILSHSFFRNFAIYCQFTIKDIWHELCYVKKCLRHINSPAPQSWGVGFSFVSTSVIIILWIFSKTFSMIIMKKSYIYSDLVSLLLKTSIRCLIVVTLHLAVQCTVAPTVEQWNSFLSDAKAVSVPPVVTNTLLIEPIPCLLKSLGFNIAIVFSPSMKISENTSIKTELFSTVCFLL